MAKFNSSGIEAWAWTELCKNNYISKEIFVVEALN